MHLRRPAFEAVGPYIKLCRWIPIESRPAPCLHRLDGMATLPTTPDAVRSLIRHAV